MRGSYVLRASVGLLIPWICGCSPSSTQIGPPGRAFVDGLGRSTQIPEHPTRIVSLAPSNTELLFAVGAGPQIVARDDDSDFPEPARALPSLGTTATRLNTEAMISLGADLILIAEITSAEQARSLEVFRTPIFYVRNPRSFDELLRTVELMGAIVDRVPEAAAVAHNLKERIDSLRKLTAACKRPRVFYEVDSTDSSKPWSAGPSTFIDKVIELAGGENFCASFKEEFPRVSIETILKGDPDVIVVGSASPWSSVEGVMSRSAWKPLTAVQSGRVHVLDGSMLSRPGPRLVEGAEKLARLIHPELFPR